jgi:plasmid stabilization system protein ParE
MASEEPSLTIRYSPTAIAELDDIWRWNAERYSLPHADEYLQFLRGKIADLARNHAKGRALGSRPDLHYIVAKRRARGHGHVAVYTFNDEEVLILHVFHTAQDWQNTDGGNAE